MNVVILAAGQGKRMRSDLAKVLHPLAGRPLIAHVLDACAAAGVAQSIAVVGHQREAVAAAVAGRALCAVQERQLGTGDAVRSAMALVRHPTVLVLCGDAPLVPAALLLAVLDRHRREGNRCTAVAGEMADPTGYGRMITDAAGRLRAIVEHRDATPEQHQVRLVNSGIYAFAAADLADCLQRLRPDNSQGEYYLTDVVRLLVDDGLPVGLEVTPDADAVLGINTPEDLARAEAILAARTRCG